MNCDPATSIDSAMATPDFDPRDRFSRWSALVAVAILAGTFLLNVAPYWQVNPQYSFGWLLVPKRTLCFSLSTAAGSGPARRPLPRPKLRPPSFWP